MPPVANAAGLLETVTAETDTGKRWLTTRAAVKAALLIGDTAKDTLIDSLIPRVSGLIANECGLARDNAGGVASFAEETLRATWFPTRHNRGAVLALPWRVPCTQIVSVTVDDEALDPAEYRLVAAVPGRLQFLCEGDPAAWSGCKIVGEFKAGFVLPGNVPVDLESACIEQMSAMVFGAGRDPMIAGESTDGVGTISYTKPGGDTLGALTAPFLLPSVRDMLAAWRNPLP